MKIFLYTLTIILGILLFRVGYVFLDDAKEGRIVNIDKQAFWDREIFIKDSNKGLDFTSGFFFKSIPPMDIYPTNKILYFKELNTIFQGNKAVITSIIIQENRILYKNSYYFFVGEKVRLEKIVIEDLTFDSITTVDNNVELTSLMKTYSSFIELWLINDLEK